MTAFPKTAVRERRFSGRANVAYGRDQPLVNMHVYA